MGLCFWGARLRFARVWTGESTGDFPERDFGERHPVRGRHRAPGSVEHELR